MGETGVPRETHGNTRRTCKLQGSTRFSTWLSWTLINPLNQPLCCFLWFDCVILKSKCKASIIWHPRLTLSLLSIPGVFWISHMPSAKPLMRTPLPYFSLFPAYGTTFSGGTEPLGREETRLDQRGRERDAADGWSIHTSGGSRRNRRGLASCSPPPTYRPANKEVL